MLVDPLVPKHDGRKWQARCDPCKQDRSGGPPGDSRRTEIRDPERDQHTAEKHEIAVGQRLQQPRGGEERQPPAPPVNQVTMKTNQRHREPEECEYLEVPNLSHSVRGEGKRQPRQKSRVAAPQHGPRQPVRGDRSNRPRQKAGEVIGQDWLTGCPEDRCRDNAEADEVFRERGHVLARKKERRVPPLGGERHHGGVPPENRRVQDRIERVAGDLVTRAP